ncbi:MAG: isopenicillin N synthase family oxygenase [Chitinophagales bacterium]|nr:isopenicillin N synthase family oxygenase [Chitinophagales bacterium]MDW8427248.1 2-oxoglutarate and iron-dependent oxygenase domain-containing protein [Chitinophagales bacterium]
MSYVPIIDLNDFLSGHVEKKRRFVKELGDAYHEVGFVIVRNHGISERLIEDLYREVKAFFSLPLEIKLKYERKELNGQRGYVPFGREHAKHTTVPDLKEFFQFGQTVTDGDPIKAEYPDNVWVEELPGFNEVMVNAFRSFEIAGNHLLRAIALYLELPENYFEKKVHNGNSILRAIHYPPITSDPGSALRAEQHEDINLITLLVGASAEGLEILTVEGNWVPVTALPGQIVVNVGDMLQRLTNNRLRSTTHRVVNPPPELWHTSRYSIPFFLHPRSDMRLDCLGSCISLENPRRYEPITAGEYLNERLVEIGLKPAKA